MDRELSQALREAQEERSRLLSLTNHVGWKWYEGILDSQIEARRNTYELRPLKTMDEVLEEQYVKGELNGLRTVKALVIARVEELENDIQNYEKELGI